MKDLNTLKTKMMDIFTLHKNQWAVFGAIAVIIFIFAVVLYVWDRVVFNTLLGKTNPLLVVAGAAVLGTVCFVIFIKKGWFAIYAPGNQKGYLAAIGLSCASQATMIAV